MSQITIYRSSNFMVIRQESETTKQYIPVSNVSYREISSTELIITYDPIHTSCKIWQGLVSEILNEFNVVYGSTVRDFLRVVDAGVDVRIQDQHTPILIAPLTKIVTQTDTDGVLAIDDQIINVTDATGALVGHTVALFHPPSIRFYIASIVAINANAITVDTPLDFAYPDGTYVDIGSHEMAVNGSITPVVFGLRGTGTPEGIELSVDVTRIMIHCLTDTATDFSKFGDLAALTNGIVLRTRDGIYNNIFNAKTTGDLAAMSFDFTIQQATNPSHGQDGFIMRLTFAGQSKMGVTLRLPLGTDVEIIIQDDLSGITHLGAIIEGHIVQN